MGVDYEAVAGYGFKVEDNLSKKGKELLDKHDGVVELMENEMEDIVFEYIGCNYSGTTDIYILCSDPLGIWDGKTNLETFRESLDKYKDYFINTDLEWICDLYIF